MSVTTEKSGATAIRPFHVDLPNEALEDLRRRIAATRLPSKELVTDRSQGRPAGDDPGARALLDDRLRLAQVRGEAEHAPAIQNRDRRGGCSFHPRSSTSTRSTGAVTSPPGKSPSSNAAI